MFKRYLTCLIFSGILLGNTVNAQRPRIGVTLSGGGAKGLAHIGILQAIDSAGLQVDYVTGTSMGSIMGALYAVGYSGDSIAAIAQTLDWGVVLSNKPTLKNVAVEEKPEFGVYAAEIPFVHGKPQFVPGVVEGEELWLTLSKYFMPVYAVKDFSQFKRGFRCIGADIETGDAVVMDHGEIVNALRGSMAIPSVFTPIQYEGKTVVDGGIVRNFPVSDVKEMGADYVIGVNVGQGLRKAGDLNTAIDVLYQISFYRDAKDFEVQKQKCNSFVQVDMPNFSAASFGSADSILKVGQEVGRQWYPVFKALADSLDRIYGKAVPKQTSYSLKDTVLVSEISYEGLGKTNTRSIEARMGLEEGRYYSADQINDAVRSAFGTRNYYKIGYQFEPIADGSAKLRIKANENSGTFLKATLHFNSFTGGALVVNATFKNRLFPRSRLIVKANIGRDPKFKTTYHKFFGKKDDYGFSASAFYEGYTLPLFNDDYEQTAEYRYKEWWFDASLHKYYKSTVLYAGYTYMVPKIIPKITDIISLEGTNRYMNVKAGFYINSKNKQYFASEGWFVKGETEYYFHQRPELSIIYDGQTLELDESAFDFDEYERVFIKAYKYSKVAPRSVLITAGHVGMQFDYKESFLNQFVVGGLTDFLRNQVPFAGLDHSTINTESVAVLQMGWQYQLSGNLYSTLTANAGLYDFNDAEEVGDISADKNFLSGYALTAGYDSPFGPLELSAMYSDQTQKLMGYVNIGFHF